MSEWIKCSDRMPNRNERVLCYNGEVLFESVWDEIWQDGQNYWELENVTHWMPLPQPPDI